MITFGYARISTKGQCLSRQLDSLKNAGCKKVYQEVISGRSKNKPKLDALLDIIDSGDTLIVDSLDRLGRTSKELISLLSHFKDQGIRFKSLKEGLFDSSSPMGEAIFQIIAILKAMEVAVLRERTLDGLSSARARGKVGGRPKGVVDDVKQRAVISYYNERDNNGKLKYSIAEIMDKTGVKSKTTIYRYVKNNKLNNNLK